MKKTGLPIVLLLSASLIGLDSTAFAVEAPFKQEINSISEQNSTFFSNSNDNSLLENPDETEVKEYGPTPRGTTITTSTVDPLWLPLGSNPAEAQDIYFHQADIKIDGKTADWKDLNFVNILPMNDINTIKAINSDELRRYNFSIYDQSNVNNSVSGSGHYKINYGNSIVFSGLNDDIMAAYTYHVQDSAGVPRYRLSASTPLGDGEELITRDNTYAEKEFYSIEHFRYPGRWDNPDTKVVALGGEQRKDPVNRFNRSISLVGEHNVIRTWSAKSDVSMFFLSNGSSTQKYRYADSQGYTYYKVTKTGLELMKTTPLTTVERTITTVTTDAQLDATARESFEDLPDTVEVVGFETYPDRNSVGKKYAQIRVSENSAVTGNKPIETVYSALFNVIDVPVELELNSLTIPIGTPAETLTVDKYIKSVKLGDDILSPSEYTAEFEEVPNTNTVGQQKAKIKVTLNGNKKTASEEAVTNVTWGSSIVTKSADNKIDASVSLLHNNNKPYLVANEGTGLSTDKLSSRPFTYVYRGSVDNEIMESGYNSVSKPPQDTMEQWNNKFPSVEYKYGDVFGYTVFQYANQYTNLKGENTWVSRNEELVRETQGYDKAYYEMTTEGFRLLHFNQFTVNNKTPSFNLNEGKESSDVPPEDLLDFPTGISNQSNYRFEYGDIDTKTSGKKESTIKVYEKLASGGEFMTTYPISYQVNYQLTETHFDEVGKELKNTKKVTNVEFGKTQKVTPTGSVTVDGTLYLYQGWLASNKTPGKDTPTAGNPPSVKDTTTYQYVYKKADSMINMTIPTGLIFETDTTSGDITSKDYEVKNNSKEVGTEVRLDSFSKVKSNVTLLKSTDKDPTKVESKARFNLTVNDSEAIKSVTEATKDTLVTQLAPNGNASIGWSGHYFGNLTQSNIVEYQMVLKFKATEK